MASILDTIVNTARDTYNSVVNTIEEKKYQSPLESMGIAMRDAMKPVCYYNKHYMYATPVSTDYIRTNDSYVAASGWIPSTYGLVKNIHDSEWEEIASNFDVQTGNGPTSQEAITNVGSTKSATLYKSYGNSSLLYVQNKGTQETPQ